MQSNVHCGQRPFALVQPEIKVLSTGKCWDRFNWLGIGSLLLLKAFKEPSSSRDRIVGFPKAELRKEFIWLENLGHQLGECGTLWGVFQNTADTARISSVVFHLPNFLLHPRSHYLPNFLFLPVEILHCTKVGKAAFPRQFQEQELFDENMARFDLPGSKSSSGIPKPRWQQTLYRGTEKEWYQFKIC